MPKISRQLKVDLYLAFSFFTVAFLVGFAYAKWAGTYYLAGFHPVPAMQLADLPGKNNWANFLCGLFYAATVVSVFFVFRSNIGRTTSIICAIFILISPVHLYMLVPSVLRDYAKAPLMLSVLAIILKVFFSDYLDIRKKLTFLGAAAVVIGVGVTVRADVFAMVPLLALVSFASLNFPVMWLKNLLFKCSWTLFFVTSIFLLQWVINKSLGGETATSSMAMTNASRLNVSSYNATIRVENPLYELNHNYADYYTMANSLLHYHIESNNEKHEGLFIPWNNEVFEEGSKDYIRLIIKTFPADIATRMLATLIKVLDYGFDFSLAPIGLEKKPLLAFYGLRSILIWPFAGLGIYCFALALLIMFSQSISRGIVWLLVICYLGAVPVVQPFDRHLFYLEWIALWHVGFIFHFALTEVRYREFKPHMKIFWGAATLASVGFLCIGCLQVLRHLQAKKITGIISEYLAAPKAAVALSRDLSRPGMVLYTSPEFGKKQVMLYRLEGFFVIRFKTAGCGFKQVMPTLQFEFPPSLTHDKHFLPKATPNFSHTVTVDLSHDGETNYFFPALTSPNQIFSGISLPAAQASCVIRMERIVEPRKHKIKLFAKVGPHWRTEKLFQELTNLEGSPQYGFKTDSISEKNADARKRRFLPIELGEMQSLSPNLQFSATEIWLHARANLPVDAYGFPLKDRSMSWIAEIAQEDAEIALIDTDILMSRPMHLAAGAHLYVSGVQQKGAIKVALIQDNQRSVLYSVSRRGKFEVDIPVPKDGKYSIGIFHNILGYSSPRQKFALRKLVGSCPESNA